jgi:hypothetical protein
MNFQKRCEFFISAGGGHIYYKNGHLYLTINGILSSLEWYITCEMVTRGYFFINVLKMEIFKIHPVYTTATSSLGRCEARIIYSLRCSGCFAYYLSKISVV